MSQSALLPYDFQNKLTIALTPPPHGCSNSSSEAKCRIVAKVALAAVSAAAKVPFIPIAMQLPGGPVFAVCNTLGYWKLEVWAGNHIIDAINCGPSDTTSKNCCDHTASKVVIWLLSFSGSILSLLPQGFAAAQYNPEPWKIPAAAVVLISGSFFPLFSIHQAITSLGSCRCTSSTTEENVKLRKQLIEQVTMQKQCYIATPRQQKLALSNQQPTPSHLQQMPNSVDMLKQLSVPQTTLPALRTCFSNKAITVISWTIGVILTLFFETILAIYTYGEAREQIDNTSITGATFASATVISNVYLTGKSMITTASTITGFVGHVLCCNRRRTLLEREAAPGTFTLKTVSGVVDALAIGPTIVIYSNYFSDNELAQATIPAGMAISVFLLMFTATLEMVEDLLGKAFLCKSGEMQQVISHAETYDRLIALIQQAPDEALSEIKSALNNAWSSSSSS